MIRVVVPMAGPNIYFENSLQPYPKPLIEVRGRVLIQHVIEYLETLGCDKRFVFIINEADARKWHLDNVLKIVTNGQCEIVCQRAAVKGAVCSTLLGVSFFNSEEPLVISNADQIIHTPLNEIVAWFESRDADAGVICFESVHPKWSYALTDNGSTRAIEVSEKRPISRNSIAGFYYFRRGTDYVWAAQKSILKGAEVNGSYFIAPTLNELILKGLNVQIYKIPNSKYTSFYTQNHITEYERMG